MAASAVAVLLIGAACATEPPAATGVDAVSEASARGQDGVDIRVDRDGTVRVNNVEHPIDRVSDAVADHDQRAVASLAAHPSTRYRLVSAVQDELRAAGLIRVVFTMVAPEAQRSPSWHVSTSADDGLAVVLPDTTMPDLQQSGVDRRNLLFLDVLRTGVVAASRGGEPDVQEIALRDVEALWHWNVARNPKSIAVARTHPDAEYRHMYGVLDALYRAKATRISLQLAQ